MSVVRNVLCTLRIIKSLLVMSRKQGGTAEHFVPCKFRLTGDFLYCTVAAEKDTVYSATYQTALQKGRKGE